MDFGSCFVAHPKRYKLGKPAELWWCSIDITEHVFILFTIQLSRCAYADSMFVVPLWPLWMNCNCFSQCTFPSEPHTPHAVHVSFRPVRVRTEAIMYATHCTHHTPHAVHVSFRVQMDWGNPSDQFVSRWIWGKSCMPPTHNTHHMQCIFAYFLNVSLDWWSHTFYILHFQLPTGTIVQLYATYTQRIHMHLHSLYIIANYIATKLHATKLSHTLWT